MRLATVETSPELLGQKSPEHGDFLLGNVRDDDPDELESGAPRERPRDRLTGRE